jgi:hypothetical protein
MTLEWLKPEEVGHMGLVYVSRCRAFMIVRSTPTTYRLFFYKSPISDSSFLGDFPNLRDAKDAAETQRALCG